ncbi:MAG: glycosyltransferase [Acidobacteria bacterium]|nr:glycosyltransferase [Acidobacteriota bacterium]
MKRNLLYIALDFPPLNSSGTYRNAKFVKYLGQFGWHPIVVTLDWHRERVDDPLDDSLLHDIPAQVPVIRLPHFNPVFKLHYLMARYRARSQAHSQTVTLSEVMTDGQSRGTLFKLARNAYHAALVPVGDTFFYWSFRVLPQCVVLARQHEVEAILASVSPWTTAILGIMLKRILRLPLIVDFRDYWTMWAVKGTHAIRDKLDAHVERWVLRQADRVICVHQAMADDFKALEPACAGTCCVITNGYDVDDFPPLSPDAHASGLEADTCQLTHTGIAWGDAALPLLQALAQLKRENAEKRLRVNFVGGLPPSSLQFIEDHHLDDVVQIQSRMAHREAIQHMRQADLLLLLIVGNEGGRKWYPGKLFEYMYAGRPVLAVAPEGIATQLVNEAGIGLTVEPHDTERLTGVLREIAADVSSFRQKYYHPKPTTIEPFNRVALTRKLASVLDEVCVMSRNARAGAALPD